jgi:DNA repair protein SbcD/Mre11
MKFLFFTDSHFRDDQPVSRIDNTYKTQFEKLGEILQIVREYNVDAVLHGGDFFNIKKPSHKLVIDIIDWCKHLDVPIYTILGNHDLVGYNLDSVQSSGLGVLVESGAIEQLKDIEIFSSEKIAIKAVHTSLSFQQNYIFSEEFNDFTKIIISHNFIIPSDTMPFQFIHPKDIKTNAHLVLCGHYHVPFDYQTHTTRWINPGTLCRWKLSERDHKPTVLLIDINNGVIDVKKIILQSAKPMSEVFNLDIVEQEKRQEKDIQSFVKSLNTITFSSFNIEEVIQQAGKEQNTEQIIIDEVLRRVRLAKESLK